jgi:hypothetical protein
MKQIIPPIRRELDGFHGIADTVAGRMLWTTRNRLKRSSHCFEYCPLTRFSA